MGIRRRTQEDTTVDTIWHPELMRLRSKFMKCYMLLTRRSQGSSGLTAKTGRGPFLIEPIIEFLFEGLLCIDRALISFAILFPWNRHLLQDLRLDSVSAVNMFHLRRSALRLLSSSPSSFIAKRRTITSFASAPLRIPRQSTSIAFQRRWATSEAEAKTEETEEAPISEIQPTPQEEVENAIHEDNAADGEPITEEMGRAGDAVERSTKAAQEEPVTEEFGRAGDSAETSIQAEESTVGSALNTASEIVSNAASSVQETARRAFEQTSEAAGYGGRSDRRDLNDRGGPSSRGSVIGEPKSTIYVGNLFFDVTENDLVKELARFGTITKCRLMRDSRGLSKGFGYVDFDNIDSATKAIETLNQQLFEGRRLAVQYAAYETKTLEDRQRPERSSKPLNPPSKTLFIGNMSFEMTDRDLNNLFRGIRNVIDVRVAIDRRTGQPRGFAHADFVDVKSAMEAMKVLEGKETYGRKLRLDYSYGPSNSPRNSGMPGSS